MECENLEVLWGESAPLEKLEKPQGRSAGPAQHVPDAPIPWAVGGACRPLQLNCRGTGSVGSPLASRFDSYAHKKCILMHMRTTLIIDQNLLEHARQLTGIRKKTELVRAGLEALIAREAARRLAALGGADPGLRSVRRRRTGAKQ